MTKTLLFDFSRTLLFPKDHSYTGKLNDLHKQHQDEPDYDFWNYFHLNNELFEYLQINQHEFDAYIFTTGRIQETPVVSKELEPLFKQIFSVKDINIPKDDPKSYQYIAKQLKLHPQMITFIDDEEKNITASTHAGMKAIKFTDNDTLIPHLDKLKNTTYIDKLAYIHINDNKLLVTLSKGKDRWYIPGGKREPEETDEQALIREVKEELSVDLIPETIKYYSTFEAQAHGKPEGTIVRMTCYEAKYLGQLTPAAEISEMDFFRYDQKSQTSPVDHLIFDHLHQNHRIA